MSTPKFQGYLIIIHADDGEVIRAFKLQRKAVVFVSQEHLRRWDLEKDEFKEGQEFESAALYYFDLKGTRLLDTYSLDANSAGDAEGWSDAKRQEAATAFVTHATQ